MSKKIKPIQNNDFFDRLTELLQEARKSVVQTVNRTMVYTYFEIGRLIVEEDQKGKKRAVYGKALLKEVSKKLIAEFGKGFSETNLKQMRQFYLTFEKSQTRSDKLDLQKKTRAIDTGETSQVVGEKQIITHVQSC